MTPLTYPDVGYLEVYRSRYPGTPGEAPQITKSSRLTVVRKRFMHYFAILIIPFNIKPLSKIYKYEDQGQNNIYAKRVKTVYKGACSHHLWYKRFYNSGVIKALPKNYVPVLCFVRFHHTYLFQ